MVNGVKKVWETFFTRALKSKSEAEALDPINVQEEIADVLIYTLLLTDRLGLDVETIIQDKLKKNALKYPLLSEKLK